MFFFFPAKLNRLKSEREQLGNEIKEFVDKYATQVDPDYNNRIISDKKDIIKDISKDSLEYLENRSIRRPTKMHLAKELEYVKLNVN